MKRQLDSKKEALDNTQQQILQEEEKEVTAQDYSQDIQEIEEKVI